MPQETFHGVPRSKIPWYPTIDYKKCIRCGKCVDYCKLGVYEFQEKEKEKISVVKNPNNCVVFCTSCEAQCPAQAITHPSKIETAKTMQKLRKAKPKRLSQRKRSKSST